MGGYWYRDKSRASGEIVKLGHSLHYLTSAEKEAIHSIVQAAKRGPGLGGQVKRGNEGSGGLVFV